MLKLYDYYRSSASYRVRIALNLKGLNYQKIPVHLLKDGGQQHSSSYRNINPHGLVPALQTVKGVLTQSLAIIEYLDEVYPNPSFLPVDAWHKGLVRAFAFSITSDIHPLNNSRVLKYLTNEFNLVEEKQLKWYRHWVETGLSALEKQLIAYKFSGDYCFGNQITLADICLIPQLYNARRFSCDLSNFHNLTRIETNCLREPAIANAFPNEEKVEEVTA